jgi:uroporphyrinogen decarboxylase
MKTIAQELVAQTRANNGLAPVDLERFWADQAVAIADPFGPHIPQVPLGIRMSHECVFAELGIPETPAHWYRLVHDGAWRAELCRAYNDKAEKIVGRRLLDETVPPPPPDPPPKQLHDIFEAKNVWQNESYWLQQSAHNEDELQRLLDRVDKRLDNLADFLVPAPKAYRFQRGPVTFATSIYGAENLLYLILDNPDLAGRFRDTILRAMLEMARVTHTEPRGFQFNDDNCYLLTPEMYEFFAFPILKTIFDKYAPAPRHRRYQHSDSAMGHLLPILARLNFTGVNFGPTLTVAEIRRHMPRTVIDGQLAPFTFSRNEEEKIVAEFLRDFEQAREQRGLVFTTAGSVNNGSRLTGLRLIMAAIQRYGRYA